MAKTRSIDSSPPHPLVLLEDADLAVYILTIAAQAEIMRQDTSLTYSIFFEWDELHEDSLGAPAFPLLYCFPDDRSVIDHENVNFAAFVWIEHDDGWGAAKLMVVMANPYPNAQFPVGGRLKRFANINQAWQALCRTPFLNPAFYDNPPGGLGEEEFEEDEFEEDEDDWVDDE